MKKDAESLHDLGGLTFDAPSLDRIRKESFIHSAVCLRPGNRQLLQVFLGIEAKRA
jgi:hypothetical protein